MEGGLLASKSGGSVEPSLSCPGLLVAAPILVCERFVLMLCMAIFFGEFSIL